MFQFLRHDFLGSWRDKLRVIACVLPLPAVPSFLLCDQHFCMCGHLAHGPYPAWYGTSDRFWIFSFCAAAILSICSSHPRRVLFTGLLMGLAAHRLLLNSAFSLVFDIPVLIAVAWLAARGLGFRLSKHETQIHTDRAA